MSWNQDTVIIGMTQTLVRAARDLAVNVPRIGSRLVDLLTVADDWLCDLQVHREQLLAESAQAEALHSRDTHD